MSGTPVDADALQRHLADTEAGPSELRDLLVRHHTDPDAVEALCDHADGEVPLQAAVFAAHEQVETAAQCQAEPQQAADDFEWQIDSWRRATFDDGTGTDLREFFRTARPAFPDEYEFLLGSIAWWFIDNVPLPILTDEVVAEMSIWEEPCPCPELGAGWTPEDGEYEHRPGRSVQHKYETARKSSAGHSQDTFGFASLTTYDAQAPLISAPLALDPESARGDSGYSIGKSENLNRIGDQALCLI